MPVRVWVDSLAEHVRTIHLTPAVAATPASLLDTFAGDPADRIIYPVSRHG